MILDFTCHVQCVLQEGLIDNFFFKLEFSSLVANKGYQKYSISAHYLSDVALEHGVSIPL